MIKKLTDKFTSKDYLVLFALIFLSLFGAYLIIAWSSYSPLDNAWSVSSYQSQTINKAGFLGAWIIDLCFVLFGYVGHLIPFLCCFIPIYFIRSKTVHQFTCTRFIIRATGLFLLILGLTVLCSSVFKNPEYYLSGGVLGGMLRLHLVPILGNFGLAFVAFIATVAGFILCSGSVLIAQVVRFYRWLTMQNEQVENEVFEEALLTDEEEYTAINLEGSSKIFEPVLNQPADNQANTIQFMNISNVTTSSFESHSLTSEVTKDNDIDEFNTTDLPISINPVTNTTTPINIYADQKMPEDFGGFTPISDTTDLPVVRIAKQGFNQETNNPTESVKSAVSFSGVFDSQKNEEALSVQPLGFGEEAAMPTITLSPSKAVSVDDNEQDFAAEFAQRGAERHQVLEAVHLQNDENLSSTVNIQQTETEQPAENTENNNGLRTLTIDEVVNLFGDNKPTSKPTTDLPTLDLLSDFDNQAQQINQQEIARVSANIEQQLRNFNIQAQVKDVLVGPVVTRYEVELKPGVKASKVTGVDTDLARALTFQSIRVAESIPGKPYIGIETPNTKRQMVSLKEVLQSPEFQESKALLPLGLGKDISGKAVVIDLAKTPHLLVAGSTGSGKSVGINSMILSLLFKVKPEQVKFIMIDPKVVELSVYNGIPHLLTEVVTDMKKAANALRWTVEEMERRYQLLAKLKVRNIEGFNEKILSLRAENIVIPDPNWRPTDSMDSTAPHLEPLSYIVVIVDEFADLMAVAGKDIEVLIARLTQKARAVGIHVILATQRPSVDVITGLIKSNIPSRIAFTVAQRNDSRTILDQNGAEALLGRGDMLYLGNGTTDLLRVHGAFMTDDEVVSVVDDWRARGKPNYITEILESNEEEESDESGPRTGTGELDKLFDEVVEYVVRTGITSASNIQRRFQVGFNRAARIMDQLEEQGIVSEMRNGKREVLARGSQE